MHGWGDGRTASATHICLLLARGLGLGLGSAIQYKTGKKECCNLCTEHDEIIAKAAMRG